MAGLYGSFPERRDGGALPPRPRTLLDDYAPETEPGRLERMGLWPPRDAQLAQAPGPVSDTADDSAAPALPYPPKPRPNLVQLNDVPIKPNAGVRPYVHPTMVDKVIGFITELRQNRVPVMLTEAFRTTEMQSSASVQGGQYGAAAPGHSLHEAGYAIDINWRDLNDAQQALAKEVAGKHGLKWGGDFKARPDPLHFYVDPFGSLDAREAAIRAAQQEYSRRR